MDFFVHYVSQSVEYLENGLEDGFLGERSFRLPGIEFTSFFLIKDFRGSKDLLGSSKKDEIEQTGRRQQNLIWLSLKKSCLLLKKKKKKNNKKL